MSTKDGLQAVIAQITGYQFTDPEKLERAFIHASAASCPEESNERLEFLGDAVLGFLTCEILYRTLTHLPEGELTKIKSLVVSRAVCAQITDELGLAQHLKVGKGMRSAALPLSVRAAILECLLGAMLEDGGLDVVRPLVRRLIEPQIQRACKAGHHRNFKSVLQQVSQHRGDGNPCFRLLDEKGPDHDKVFEVAVELSGVTYASRWAPSKRAAEQGAAENALRALGVVVDGPDGEPEVDWSRLSPAEDGAQAGSPDILSTIERATDSAEPDASAA